MWSNVVEILLKILAVILPSFISYGAGKKAVESDMKDETISDAKKRNEVELEITKSHANDIDRKRLRDKWHE